jgi:hypothetical protein
MGRGIWQYTDAAASYFGRLAAEIAAKDTSMEPCKTVDSRGRPSVDCFALAEASWQSKKELGRVGPRRSKQGIEIVRFSPVVQIAQPSLQLMMIVLAQVALLVSTVDVSEAPALTRHPRADRECAVVSAVKLLGGLDEQRICTAISRAMAARAPAAHYRVEVQVRSESKLTAVLFLDGRALPAETVAVSDGILGAASIQRLANRLAGLAVGQ